MNYIPKHIFILFIIMLMNGCKKVNEHCNLNAYQNAPTQNWYKSHSGSLEEAHGHFILTCSDGGFLQVGETGFLKSSSKILVVKTDSEGSLLWKKEFSTGNKNLGNSAIETTDGYLIAGMLNENSALIKLDKTSGTTMFEKTFNNGGNNAIEHLAITSTNIIAAGYKNAQDNTNTFYTEGEGCITFLDLNGNKISNQDINSFMAHAYRIKYFNNELLISGLTEGASDYALMKMDTTGTVIWNKTFGGNEGDHCFGMDINNSGEIFLTGHTKSGTENWDTYTIKLDNNGNKIWELKAGNPRGFKPKFIHDEAWGIKATADGGCIVVAGTGDEYGRYKRKCGNDGDNSNTWKVYLIKINSSGIIDWQQTYGGEGNWAGEDIDLTPDGAAIIAVDDGQFGFLKINGI